MPCTEGTKECARGLHPAGAAAPERGGGKAGSDEGGGIDVSAKLLELREREVITRSDGF